MKYKEGQEIQIGDIGHPSLRNRIVKVKALLVVDGVDFYEFECGKKINAKYFDLLTGSLQASDNTPKTEGK